MRHLILPLFAACLCAADPVGLWRFGIGSVDGQPARVGTIVLTGQTVVAADAAPMRLVCSEAPGITTILAAGSAGSFSIETLADGGRVLILDLERGVVQVDVTDKTPFAGVRVRGAALDLRVTGTLFVVERTRRDADYVALVRGKLKVGLRPAVAKALGKAGELELLERQGVGADTSTGLGTPTALSARPQVAGAAGMRAAVAEQGTGLSDQGTAWDIDLGAELTGVLIEGTAPELAGGPAPGLTETTAGAPAPTAGSPFSDLAEDLVDSLSELGSPPQPVGDQAIEGGGSTSPASGGSSGLPAPPGPP